MHRIFTTPVSAVYPHYVSKVERKGRSKEELDEVIQWLTGYDDSMLGRHLADGTTFEQFFADARLNPNAALITGTVCGVRVQEVGPPDAEDPLPRPAGRRDRARQEDGEDPPRGLTVPRIGAPRDRALGQCSS